MINVSKAFRKELYEGHRSYLENVNITLKNEQEINLTNDHLWGGGLSFDDAVSNDNSFDVGAAVINKCTVVINNIYDDFSDYDFGGAELIVYVGLELPDGTKESIRKGTYTVDEAQYNGSIITLTCLDNMHKFDKAYTKSKLIYPATLDQIVRDACDKCGVDLQTLTFPHRDFIVQERPTDEAITFRSVISWAAQIAGCFCRCDVHGRLELKWYNQQALETVDLDGGSFSPWTSGETVDGGSFSPWTSGTIYDGGSFGDRDNIHHIFSRYSANISVDDVVITGVRVLEKTKEDDKDAIVTYQSGTDGYVISIENNALIQGGSGQSISNWIGEQLIGFRFRKADVSHSSDPTIEAGDVAMLSDRKGNTYRMIVSSTRFTTGGAQSTTSSAQTPARNSADRFSAETRNYVDYRKDIEKERTDREKALENLKNRIDNSSGLFTTEEELPDKSIIFYMHNKPILAESDIVWKMTAEAWGVSTDGGKTYNAGMTVDGDTIVRILTAVGVNADWIKTGAISVRDTKGNETFYADTETGTVRIKANSFSLTSGDTIESIAQDAVDGQTQLDIFNKLTNNGVAQGITLIGGKLYVNGEFIQARGLRVVDANNKQTFYIDRNGNVSINASSFSLTTGDTIESIAQDAVDGQTQTDILKRLTNNYADKGIYLSGNKLYISFSAAKGGQLTLGGSNNGNGILKVLSASGTEIGTWDKDGIHLKKGEINGPTITVGGSGNEDGVINVLNGSGYKTMEVNSNGLKFYDGTSGTFGRARLYGNSDGFSISTLSNTGTVVFYVNLTKDGTFDVGADKIRLNGSTGEVQLPQKIYSYATPQSTTGQGATFKEEGNYNFRLFRGTSSSKRYKDIGRPLGYEDVQGLYNIKPVLAKYKEGYLQEDDERNGVYYPMLIAEEVEKYNFWAADHNQNGEVENWNIRVLIPCMIQALKEQKKEIDELKNLIKEIKTSTKQEG